MKNVFILTIFIGSIFTTNKTFCQNEKENWFFGTTNRGLHFDPANSNAVSIESNGFPSLAPEGRTVISNPLNGNLIFYTDGIKVIDKTHNQMPNGFGLMGVGSSFNTGKSCINPSNCNQYFVFSNNYATELNGNGTLHYSIVDMTLPGNGTIANPLGDLDTNNRNILITPVESEAFTIIPNSNTNGYWLLVAINTTHQIKIFEINSQGIAYSSTFNLSNQLGDSRSMNYSAVNGKFCVLSMIESNPCLIFDFDASNGSISNETLIPGTPWGNSTNYWQGSYDSEWSEDGTKLYISKYRFGGSSGGRLYQYDLTTPLINPALIYSVSSSNNIVAKGLKRGPDQKIYMLSANSSGITRYLHVINNPNLAGSSCNFVANQVDMGIDMGITHLFPNFLTANSSVIASCFGLVGIEESSEKLKINLFPNPTTGKFQIEVSNSDLSAIDFIIYNSVGQQIQVGYNELNSNTVEFDLSSKDAGIYILKVREGDKSMTLRLVKE